MAAIAPSTITLENVGSLTMHICTFADTADDTDTWPSGLSTNIVGYWANATDDATQTNEGIDVALATGTFTFSLGENDRSFMLYVLSKS